MVLEQTLESPLDCKIKPIYPKGNPPWVFIRRTDAEAEAPIFGHLMRRASSLEKTLLLGKIEGKKRRVWQRMRWLRNITNWTDINLGKPQETTEDTEALHAIVFWSHKELDTTYQLNNSNKSLQFQGQFVPISLRPALEMWQLCHGFSLVILLLPPGGAFRLYKTAHRIWLRVLSISLVVQ